jgi:predicted heme/steroid binding protein
VEEPTTVPREYKEGYSWLPRGHPPTVLFTTYTPQTLVKFDGRDGGRILLAIDGIVFDVTAGRNFYGPGMSNASLFVLANELSFDIQRACMVTLPDVTLRAEWQSSRLIKASAFLIF